MRKLLIISVVCTCFGCATPYQEMGFAGGVTAQQMTSNTFRIVSRGNGYTDSTAVQDYLMLKSAETTIQNGGTHFLVITAADASRNAQIVTGGIAHTTFNGNSATTTYTPPTATNIFKPGQDAYIRVINVPQGTQPPDSAVAATEVIQFVGPRVRRPQ